MAAETKLAEKTTEARSLLDAIRNQDSRAAREAGFEAVAALATKDASQLGLQDGEIAPLDVAQYGEGFVVVPRSHKKFLIGVPFAIVELNMNPSKKVPGSYFGSIKIITANPVDSIRPGCCNFIVNDGGTGIFAQLVAMRGEGNDWDFLPVLCRHGLRMSGPYPVTQDDPTGAIDPFTHKPVQVPVIDPVNNQPVVGETFYLDESL